MRKLALVMAVALASGRAYALGLGGIELHSALNEPLDAEIRLLAEKSGELDNAVVRLAPEAEFTRAGIERPSVLSDLKLAIVREKGATPLVKITSTKPIREPFLDFVVQLRWQSGRLLREYTVLLDPPVFGEEKAAPVTAPITATPVPAPVPASQPPAQAEPTMAAPPAPAPATTSPRPAPAPRESRRSMVPPAPAAVPGASAKSKAAGKHTYGPTQRADTLWNIAKSLRPDDSVSVYQMMIALLRENPEAFYHGNVNNLMAGYVLRVPDKSVAAAIDQKEAVREAARQYEQWKRAKHGGGGETSGEMTTSQSGAEKSQAAAAAPAQEKETARLRLVAPDGSADQAAAGGVQTELDKLRSDLSIALETSDTAKRENEELRSRVAALEEQIRLLTLKDQALSEMQKRPGQEAPAAAQTPAPAEEAPAAAAAKPAPVKPAPAKPAAKQPEESLDLFANPTLIGAMAGAALLLLSVIWLIVRRRRGGSAEEDEQELETIGDEMGTPAINIQLAEEDQTEAHPMEEEVNDPQMSQVADEVAQDAEQHISQTTSDLEVLQTTEGDIDPIVEADVYLAYRRYQQAEALVQSALEKQPDRQDLQAKLLEIYYAAKNSDAFQAMAQALYVNLGSNPEDPLWQRILPMGRELCPEHELFASAADDHAAVQADSAGDGLSNEPAVEPVTDAGLAVPAETGEESFDLNLAAGEAQEENMDFDLNLGGETAAPEQPPESAESLGASLDFDGLEAESEKKEAAAEGEAPQEQAQNPWEIESAMSEFGNIDFGLDDSDLLAGTDVVGTKLDLARAYIDMGDNESAHDILKEVVEEGNEKQKQEAAALMEKTA